MHTPFLTAAVLLWTVAGLASATDQPRPSAPILVAASDAAADPYDGLARASLSDAVARIEGATAGRVLEIRWLHGPGHGFEAVLAKQDGVEYIRLNPLRDTLVTLRAEEIPQWMLPWKVRQDLRNIAYATVPLATAIHTAEDATRSIAVDAGLAKPLSGENSVLAYQIEVLRGGKPDRVAVDAVTGERIDDPDEVLDTWTPEKTLDKTVQERE